ncbi:transmembrane protein 11 homolog, mitochondrial-like [Homalodisca vitripennis]|uniref:transmembrane protein 11 homolog, mitochondrial-like n=1 Tax=Homalodisca vitripennis TaxID=197043 RepID=UPI001EEBD163|nr:transmembrane protein 11 homolog, mitochondrial-like [Homalodisca vitripennis]
MSVGEKDYSPSDTAVIKEVYDGENAHEMFGEELERALEASCQTIIIEPSRLGDETARWIAVGNCLHKTAVISGLGSIVTALVWTERPVLYMPLAVTSLFCTGLYTVSWQFDPCCQYQVSTDSHSLTVQPHAAASLSARSPVVLVRRDDTRRKLLHSAVTLAASLLAVWRCYITCVK